MYVEPNVDELGNYQPFQTVTHTDDSSTGITEDSYDDSASFLGVQWRTLVYENAGIETYLNILTPGLPLDKGDVTELQQLVSKTYWPFNNIEQWMLAKALTFPSPLSNKMIRNIAVERYCPWITVGKGFKSVRDFRKRLDQLPAKGGEWQQSYVTRRPYSSAVVSSDGGVLVSGQP